ncbi:MAG: SPOR domain-containing protein [Bacteroidales bacterium]|nr:SPOR domain-containing protein [Bacteroidales bacterium]
MSIFVFMKVARLIAIALVCIACLSGCDAIRTALGKPTSKDIAALRAQRQQMQHTGDSLAVEMDALPDSVDAAVEPAEMPPESEPAVQPAVEEPQENEEAPAGLAEGYYVVLGSFKNEDNAQYYYNSLSASGAEVHLVKMKNGFTAVMICHGSTYEESYRKMLDFYSDKKKPEDIWIYNTAKKMHLE